MSILEVHIFDVDGCIVDSTHRYRSEIRTNGLRGIDLQYWRDNEHKANEDTLLPLAEHYQELLQDPEMYVIIATSRVCHPVDFDFIYHVLGQPNYLISREEGDMQRAHTLKAMPIKRLFNLRQFQGVKEVWFYEDNKETLVKVCKELNAIPYYIMSTQGF